MTHCCEPSASAVLRATSSSTSSSTVEVMAVLASEGSCWRVLLRAVGARVVDGRTRQLAQPAASLRSASVKMRFCRT
jgi:hypothetical protein